MCGLTRFCTFKAVRWVSPECWDSGLISCVLLDAATNVEAGDAVFGTGEVVGVPVGEAMLGRIVDPLGRPLDGKGAVENTLRLPIERPAPSIIERDLVTEPVQTGIVAIDTLFALGRGQRELIIGDHSTGKTTLAIDTLIAQRDSDMLCIYVAVGQKTSSVRRAIDALQSQGNFERCIVLVASSASAPGLQWIAPYAGMTMAEYFRDKGQHALIVIDDLSKHAATHREIALLTRQSPGREAYPGDVFYIHARLLERAAKLSSDRGGGSLTALPIAETDARQPLGLHPDQPDLDHRRANRAGCEPVPSGPETGGGCGAERQPRRRQDPGARPARRGRHAAP
jgi:F-type H+-transporting ATPase subunit alpha